MAKSPGKPQGSRPGKTTSRKKAYTKAGVDIDSANVFKKTILRRIKATHGPEVLGKVGGFGGLYRADFKGMKEPVLVSSVDGVGTKLNVAVAAGRHDTVGQDLVNHCVNDIAVLGADPLFFLDYISGSQVPPEALADLIKGFARACRAAGCALIGGETAQMPGMYRPGDYDVAAAIVGVVDRRHLIDGSRIKPGDAVLGLRSNGLHTNGYSLARKVLFEQMRLRPGSRIKGLRSTVADELLRIHRNYHPVLARLPKGMLKGAVHITGGGLIDNPPRILPPGCTAAIDTTAWKPPPIFRIIQENGDVDREEMYQVFNMGIGMLLVVDAPRLKQARQLTKAIPVGRIERGAKGVELQL